MDAVRADGLASARQLQALREATAANGRAERLSRESALAQREAAQLQRRADRLQGESAEARSQAALARRDAERQVVSRSGEPGTLANIPTTSLASPPPAGVAPPGGTTRVNPVASYADAARADGASALSLFA